VRAALAASRSLIVVCSPPAAASPWVAREIETFRALHPDRPVLTAIRSGEPQEAFPAALRVVRDDGALIEPLAADFRRGRDGDQLGLLKLVAGVIGIGLDELVQRDAHRRNQRVTAVTAGALAAVVVMSVLTGFALTARQDAERQRAEAQRQRAEAEGLVEYMLTDLREKLNGVGRLDVMTAVNERALHYYHDQDLSTLPASSLERRARVLQAMGADDQTRGDMNAAVAKFEEAGRFTTKLLAEAPNDPERIFMQAQSEFWIGTTYYYEHQSAKAKGPFLEYKKLADRLVAMFPGNLRYLHEAGYAEGSLCDVALDPPQDKADAMKSCSLALKHLEEIARRGGMSDPLKFDIANRHAWLADAYLANRDVASAESHRLTQERMLNELLARDPRNMKVKTAWVTSQRLLAWLEYRSGHDDEAKARLERAIGEIDAMVRFDANNKYWSGLRSGLKDDLEKLKKD
jgi:tetratricopeptide (TPR) repeat protein